MYLMAILQHTLSLCDPFRRLDMGVIASLMASSLVDTLCFLHLYCLSSEFYQCVCTQCYKMMKTKMP